MDRRAIGLCRDGGLEVCINLANWMILGPWRELSKSSLNGLISASFQPIQQPKRNEVQLGLILFSDINPSPMEGIPPSDPLTETGLHPDHIG